MKKAFALRFLIDALGRVSTILLTAFLARWLGVEDFGRVTFGLSFASVCSFFAEAGIHLMVLRELGRAAPRADGPLPPAAAAVWNEFFGLKLSIVAAVFAAGSLIGWTVWPWEGRAAIVLLLAWMAGNTVTEFLNQTCNATHRVAMSAWVLGVQRLAVFAGAAGALLSGGGVTAVCFGFGAGSLAGTAAGFLLLRRRLNDVGWPEWRPAVWGVRLKESLPLAAANVFAATHIRLGILLLPWLRGERETGLFGAAHKVFEAGYMLPAALMSVAVPRLAHLQAESPSELRAETRRLFGWLAGLSAAWLIGGWLFAGAIVRLLFGESFAPAADVLRVLVLANAIVFINYLFTHLLVVYDRLARHAANEAVAFAAAAVLTFTLGRRYGMEGAAWSVVAGEALLFALTLTALPRKREAAR